MPIANTCSIGYPHDGRADNAAYRHDSIKGCYHIMAVKKSLGMEIKQKATPNMSSLSAADKKSKAGRKRPRPGDFDYILEEHEQPDR